MQAVHGIWLSSPRAPPGFHIENKVLSWFDLPCARGAVFSSSCPCQCPSYPGIGKKLALAHPFGLAGSQMRRGFHQQNPCTSPSGAPPRAVSKSHSCQSHSSLRGPWPLPRWGGGRLPMGSLHFRVALQAEKYKFSFVLPVLSLIPFSFL